MVSYGDDASVAISNWNSKSSTLKGGSDSQRKVEASCEATGKKNKGCLNVGRGFKPKPTWRFAVDVDQLLQFEYEPTCSSLNDALRRKKRARGFPFSQNVKSTWWHKQRNKETVLVTGEKVLIRIHLRITLISA